MGVDIMDITKWEYETVYVQDMKKINELGRKGWEAFANNPNRHTLIFKRPCGRLHVIEKVNGVEINSTQTQVPNSVDYER